MDLRVVNIADGDVREEMPTGGSRRLCLVVPGTQKIKANSARPLAAPLFALLQLESFRNHSPPWPTRQ